MTRIAKPAAGPRTVSEGEEEHDEDDGRKNDVRHNDADEQEEASLHVLLMGGTKLPPMGVQREVANQEEDYENEGKEAGGNPRRHPYPQHQRRGIAGDRYEDCRSGGTKESGEDDSRRA